MKLKITTLIILLFGLPVLMKAQSKTNLTNQIRGACTMRIKDSPTVMGINLGMTRAEVRKEYPKMVFTDEIPKEKLENKGILAGMASKAEITNPVYKETLDEVSIIFGSENKILTMTFVFNGLITGTSVKDLSAKISDLYKLPIDFWESSRGGGSNLGIYCDDFAIATEFNNKNKQILFLVRNPRTLTDAEKKILQP